MNLLSTVLAATFGILPSQGTEVTSLTVETLVSFVITAILVVSGVVFFFMLIIGGIRWIVSGGDKASTESARAMITSALIGLVIVFASWAIVLLIGQLFGLGDITSFELPII